MADTGFDELRELAEAAGDTVSLAMGMAGWVSNLIVHARFDEASRLASELIGLLDSIGDPTLTLGLLYAAVTAKWEAGELTEALRCAERMIELADGDTRKGDLIIGSPLIGAILLRGCVRCCLGDQRWRGDIDQAVTMARAFDPTLRAIVLQFAYGLTAGGARLPDAKALNETAELVEVAARLGDDFTLACARYVRGVVLVSQGGPQRADGFALLAAAREAALQERFTMIVAALIDTQTAMEKARVGDLDSAIELSRTALEQVVASGDRLFRAQATATLVGLLLRRGRDLDLQKAQAAVDALTALPSEPGFVLNEIQLLRMRALLAQTRGDDAEYRDYRDRYRAMATELGFEGHMKWAEAMP
jgi:adenylate cyclase